MSPHNCLNLPENLNVVHGVMEKKPSYEYPRNVEAAFGRWDHPIQNNVC